MHPVLQKLQRELHDGLAGLSAEQTQTRRGPDKWNIQQIVEHLLLTYESTRLLVEGRIAKGTPTKAMPTVQQRLGQFVIVTMGRFPGGRISPVMVSPPEGTVRMMSAKELDARVAEELYPMDALFAEAERMWGPSRRCMTHGALGSMTAQQWRRFHFVHGEHHLRQILATRTVMGV
ncbi:hypothetical protein GRAN_2648 [Granulicella sibirica]|uniref:DinB-like domain-containing protein n=2 Tax=Granulicella sibirica TaxID=2479048 RepID=A0A4Q0T2J6_9BACT|nr:hypothetical protein GRAN_2648 [Granulicella sibirica]